MPLVYKRSCHCFLKLDNHPLDRDVNPEEPVEEIISKFDDLESKNHNKTTQKMVNILADFLDGEVCLILCSFVQDMNCALNRASCCAA